jgi:hypothetical protein
MKNRLTPRDIEFYLFGMGIGIFAGASLAGVGQTVANWTWLLGVCFLIASVVLRAVAVRRLHDKPSTEKSDA